LKSLLKLLVAHIKQFSRQRAALFWTIAFPIFFILLFGAVFGRVDSTSFNVGVVDEDGSPEAAGLVAALESVEAFKVKVGDNSGESDALNKGDRSAVVVIPPGFGQTISQHNRDNVTVYYDVTQSTSQQVVLPIILQVVDGFDRAMARTPTLIGVDAQSIQARHLRAIDYLVPGILAMALMQLGIFAAAPLVVDRQNRVLKRLGATPLRRSALVISTVIFRLLIAVGQAALIIAVARLVFHVPMLGNWFSLVGVILLGTLTFLALGFLMSAFAKTEETVMPMLMVVQFPMMFLSGIFFPVDMMPDFMRPILNAMPLTYLGDSLRQIMVGASSLHPHYVNLAVLGGWFLACLVGAVRFFRWE
jgi:ABC-2 type transport system permease protein